MTSHCIPRTPARNFLATVLLVTAAVLMFTGERNVVEANEFPAFFLKAAKSVPRIGRRGGSFEDFFYKKIAKSVPRIGRREYSPASLKTTEGRSWYANTPADLSRAGGNEFIPVENYPNTVQQYPELWDMIVADGASDSPTASGFNGDVWQREKRTGNEPAEV